MGIELSIDLLPEAKQLSMVDKSAFSVRLYGHLYSQPLHWGDSSECIDCTKSILLPRRKAVERLLHYVMLNDSACDLVPTPIVASLSAW